MTTVGNKEVGARVKSVRKALRMTQENFAEGAGITQSTLCAIEKGRQGVSKAVLLLICQKHGISVEWLLTGEGEPYGLDGEIAAEVWDDPALEEIMAAYHQLGYIVTDTTIERLQNLKPVELNREITKFKELLLLRQAQEYEKFTRECIECERKRNGGNHE